MPKIQVGGRDPELSDRLSDELDAFNLVATGADDQESLTVKITDDDGSLIAGMAGWTWGGGAGIEMVWVHADHRKDGWGRRLIEAAEDVARERGCTDISVTSFSFQAPDFYQRLGYRVTGERLGMPAGATDVIMWKSLVGRNPVQLAVVVDFDETDEGPAYEDRFLTFVKAHGGRVERRLTSADRRTEVHVIWFDDRARYEAFRVDPARPPRPAGLTTRVIEM